MPFLKCFEKIGLTNLKGFNFPIQRPRCEGGRVNARGNDDIVNISIELLNLNRCRKRGYSLDLRLKPTFRGSKLRNKQPDSTIKMELTNRPEEVADRSSGTSMFMDDISSDIGFLHTFLHQRLKDGHATGYTASYGIIKITRETEQRY